MLPRDPERIASVAELRLLPRLRTSKRMKENFQVSSSPLTKTCLSQAFASDAVDQRCWGVTIQGRKNETMHFWCSLESTHDSSKNTQ